MDTIYLIKKEERGKRGNQGKKKILETHWKSDDDNVGDVGKI
jgi:hypothetical protein